MWCGVDFTSPSHILCTGTLVILCLCYPFFKALFGFWSLEVNGEKGEIRQPKTIGMGGEGKMGERLVKCPKEFWSSKLTINVTLILQVRGIIFFMWAKHMIIHLEGYLEEHKTFL